MTFLPIVERELRAAARRHGTYSTRLAIALAALAISTFIYLVNPLRPRQVVATYIFQGLSALALTYCLYAGRRFTADCLSEEKREGTLGLLFLTDLKGYDVVFGKLTATSLNGFYGLLALFPVLALPLLLGGVSNAELWRMVLVLVTTFLFSLAVGVVASVLSRDSRRAMGLNLLLLLSLVGALPACAGAIAYFSPAHTFIPRLLYSCPVYSLYLSFDLYYRTAKEHFWLSVALLQALTWLLVALASWIAPRAWQDRPTISGKWRWRDLWEIWIYGNASERKALRTRLLDINAFYWLSSRARLKPAGVWVFLAFVAAWWIYVGVHLNFRWYDEAFGLITALMLNSVFKLWIAIEAGQRLAEDRKIGSLELLLSTPLGAQGLLRGQALALRRQFLKPLMVVVVAEVLLTFLVAHFGIEPRAVAFGMAGILMLVIDVAALAVVGLFTALTVRNPNFASVSAIFRIMILPWVVFCALVALISAVSILSRSEGPGWKFYLHLWFWLGVATDLAFALPAWHRLHTQFYQLALPRRAALR